MAIPSASGNWLDAAKRFVISQPASKDRPDFNDWMISPGNEKLAGVVDHLMAKVEFGPGSTG